MMFSLVKKKEVGKYQDDTFYRDEKYLPWCMHYIRQFEKIEIVIVGIRHINKIFKFTKDIPDDFMDNKDFILRWLPCKVKTSLEEFNESVHILKKRK